MKFPKSNIVYADFATEYEAGVLLKDIAARLGCSESFVGKLAKRAGAAPRPPGRPVGYYCEQGDGEGLRCEKCGSARIDVIKTRAHRNSTRRERRCRACRLGFFTIELRCTPQGDPLPEALGQFEERS